MNYSNGPWWATYRLGELFVKLGPSRGRDGARPVLGCVVGIAPHERRLSAAGAGVDVQLPAVVQELVVQNVEGDEAGPGLVPRRRDHRCELRVADPLHGRVRPLEALPRKGHE